VGQRPAEPAADGHTERKFKVKGSKFKVKRARAAGAAAVRRRARLAREDRMDVAAARKALAGSGERILYEKVRKELGEKLKAPVRKAP